MKSFLCSFGPYMQQVIRCPFHFCGATDISPIALLSDNVLGGIRYDNSGTVAAEALQELFSGDGPSKKGRRIQNEVIAPNPSPSLSPSQAFLCLFVFILYAADATSSKCLPKTDFKLYAAESGAGFSLPQNVKACLLIFCECWYKLRH